MLCKKILEENGINLIPVEDLEISNDNTKNYGFDFTVDRNFTFSINGGVFVWDTMAVYAPLSEESQHELKTKLFTPYSGEGYNGMTFSLSMEMVTGLFTLTYTINKSAPIDVRDVHDVYNLHIGQKINIEYKGSKRSTTAGRIIFNQILPKNYPFVDKPIKKKDAIKILKDVIKNNSAEYMILNDNMMKLGSYYSTLYPKTISLDLLYINKKLEGMKSKLGKESDQSEAENITKNMEIEMLDNFKNRDNPLYYTVESGGSKGTNQIRQLVVSKGLVADPNDNVLPPIVNAISDGYTPEMYFDVAAGARTGVICRALRTASGGYAYRKMVFISGDVTADINNGDCGTKRTLDIKLTPEEFSRMGGRYVVENGKIVPIREDMIGNIIHLRSPIYCKSKSICRVCYGKLLEQIGTKNVGIVAAQQCGSLSEKIMKCSTGLIESGGLFISFEDIFDGESEGIAGF